MGMQPISGYNYGARHYDRVKQTLRLGIIAGCTITTVGFLISELFPSIFVGMFTTNHELTEQATLALRIGVSGISHHRSTNCDYTVFPVNR